MIVMLLTDMTITNKASMKYFFSTDHKIIGLQYMFTGMFMAIVGGYFAYAFRMQLAFPGMEVPLYGTVGPGEYNMLITNHGSIMIFWVAMPVHRCFRKHPDSTDDWLRRHGFPQD